MTDRQGFTALVRELRAAFTGRDWELTAAVAASPSKVEAGYQVQQLSSLLDAIHLMSYDLHGSWEDTVRHHSVLRETQDDQLSVHTA